MPSAFDRLNKVGFTAPKKLSRFDLSFSNSISQNGGEIMPILCKEVIAGDTFSITSNHVTRMITPAVPVMDNLIMDQFYFFVPMRLCSKDSKDWEAIFGTDKGLLSYNEQTAVSTGNALVANSSSGRVIYGLDNDQFGALTQLRYGALAALGYPLINNSTSNNASYINLFKANAYIRIFNDWFRDENLQSEIPLANTSVYNHNTGSNSIFWFWRCLNPDSSSSSVVSCLYANRLHDYFTSCLPSPQNGQAVLMPIVGNAPVLAGSSEHTTSGNQIGVKVRNASSGSAAIGNIEVDSYGYLSSDSNASLGSDYHTYFSNLYADLSAATGATITALRQAFAIQAILERDMLGGHKRYNELLQAHFNTSPYDSTLQRSQYLGSMRSMLSVSQVIQSTPTQNSPLGSTGAFSNTSNTEFIGKFSFNEPGYLMGVSVIRPLNTFAYQVDKSIYRNRRFDWYWPLLANLSEQPVKLNELDASLSDSTVLGYQEAWQDYRVGRNELHGAFLYDTLVKQWTFADFTTNSSLADVVGYKDTISQTLVASGQSYQFISNFYFDIKADRPLPMFSIPARIGGYF